LGARADQAGRASPFGCRKRASIMARYFLSSVAEGDMAAIWEHIAADSVLAADRVIDQFTSIFERIAVFPEAGSRYQHPAGEFRVMVAGAYLVFYKIQSDGVDIVRVLHGARRWEDLL